MIMCVRVNQSVPPVLLTTTGVDDKFVVKEGASVGMRVVLFTVGAKIVKLFDTRVPLLIFGIVMAVLLTPSSTALSDASVEL